MEVKDNKESISLVEEEIVDLPVADEQADETNGGAVKASPKLFLACATGQH